MQFDFTLAANQSQHIDVVGTFLKYKDGSGKIRVRLDGGGYIDLLPGQGVNNVNFKSVDVQDRTGAQNVGTLLAGIYDFRDDRITGTVEVVDGGKARTLSKLACIGFAGLSADAAKFSHVQLWNPTTSGLNLYVGQIAFNGATVGVNVTRYDTPLATLARQASRKRFGAVQSVAEMRTEAYTGIYIEATGQMAKIDPSLKLMKFSEPFMLPPGTGLILVPEAINQSLGGTFEFVEEPI